VWDAGVAFTPQSAAEAYTITYNNSTDGAGTTGALTLAIYYVDSTTGKSAITLHTLGNDGSDDLTISSFGINRVAVASSGSADVNTNAITITGATSSNVAAFIPAGKGVTNQAFFTVGSNEKAFIYDFFLNIGKAGGSNAKVIVKAYVYNRSPADTVYELFRSIVNTATEQTIVWTRYIPFVLNPNDVIYFVADTDTNAASCEVRFNLNLHEIA